MNSHCRFGNRCWYVHPEARERCDIDRPNAEEQGKRSTCKYFMENRCFFGNQCWNRHGKVRATGDATQPPANTKHWSRPAKADGYRKGKMKKSKSFPSLDVTKSASHSGNLLEKTVEVAQNFENEVNSVKDATEEEIIAATEDKETKVSDDETSQPTSKKRKNRRKKRSANKLSGFDDRNMQIDLQNDSQASRVDNTEENEVFEKLQDDDKNDTGIDFDDCGKTDSEVDSEEEMELRKICTRDFSIDEKYEDYDPKDLKYIYGCELSLIKEKRKAQEKDEEINKAVEATKSNEESKNVSQSKESKESSRTERNEESFSQSTEGSQDANNSKKWKSKFTEDQLKIPHPATEEWAARVRQDMADEYQWKMEQGMILGKVKRKEEDKENKNLREKGKETII